MEEKKQYSLEDNVKSGMWHLKTIAEELKKISALLAQRQQSAPQDKGQRLPF